MSGALERRVATAIATEVDPALGDFARALGDEAGALAVLFYGSTLRTGDLSGVHDFYVLLPGEPIDRIWPRISYRESEAGGLTLRAKVATMALATFARAARGDSRDTTIWARFVQPSALAWARDAAARAATVEALADAARTAGRLAAALGPDSGTAGDYWRVLFRATYRAEFRVEQPGREDAILAADRAHFDGLLPLAWDDAGIAFTRDGECLASALSDGERRRIRKWWSRRRRWGKPLNLVRLAKASATFDGAARYAAWKIHRHTGVVLEVTPWRERHPLLAAPWALWRIWRARGL